MKNFNHSTSLSSIFFLICEFQENACDAKEEKKSIETIFVSYIHTNQDYYRSIIIQS